MTEAGWEKLIAESLNDAAKKIEPPRELLSAIIARRGSITARMEADSRSKKNNGQDYFSFLFKQKLFVPAAVLAILLVAFFSLPHDLKNISQSASIKPTVSQVSSVQSTANSVAAVEPMASGENKNINQPPLTTDDVDAAVVAILASVSDENSTLTSDVDDESLSDADSAAINNLMQNYDQNQF